MTELGEPAILRARNESMPIEFRSEDRRFVIALVAFAFLLRLGYALVAKDLNAVPRADESVFVNIAISLLEGNGYTMNGTDATAQRPPFYPFLLTLVFGVFGKSWAAARLVTILFSALTVGLVFFLARRLFGEATAKLAGAVAAVYPPFVGLAWELYSDNVYVLLFTLFLLLAVRLHGQRLSPRAVFPLAFVSAAATLTRTEFGVIAGMTALWLLASPGAPRRARKASLMYVALFGMLISPWIVRNRIVFGEFVLSTNFGQVIWGVYNPRTFSDVHIMGGWSPPKTGLENKGEPRRADEDLKGAVFLPETEWDARQAELGLRSLRDHWTRLPKMAFYKLQRLFFSMGAVEALARFPLIYFFTYASFGLLLNRRTDVLPLYLAAFGCVITTLLFYTDSRLRLPFDVILLVVASYGALEHWRAFRASRGRAPSGTA